MRRPGVARVAALVVLALLGGAIGYLRTWPPVSTVMSGSMSPAIETGDVVVMRKLQRAPRKGDVIAVSVPDAARSRYGYPPKVIHRVVAVAPDGQITTKGDARKKPDPFTVPRSSVTTEVALTLPAAGRVLAFLGSTLGLIWLVSGVLFLVILPRLERQREAGAVEVGGIEEMRSELHADMEAVLAELVRLQAKVDSDAHTRAELEDRLADLTAALDELPQRMGTVVLPADQVAQEVPQPLPALAAEPEPYGAPIEPWTNVFTPEPIEELPPEPDRYWRVPSPAPSARARSRSRSRALFNW